MTRAVSTGGLLPLVVLALLLPGFELKPSVTLVQKFCVRKPAFVSLYPYAGGHGSDLLISSFSTSLIFKDKVYRVEHIEQYLGANLTEVKPKAILNPANWPNEVSGVYGGAAGDRTVAVPGGFLVPLKTKGSITLVNISGSNPGKPQVITGGKDKWFYHRVEWADMDRDGVADALTARAYKPLIGKVRGQLVWLKNPKGQKLGSQSGSTWQTNVIADGPDVNFELVPLMPTLDGWMAAIFVGQFFNPSLKVFWVGTSGNWSDSSKIQSRVIDSKVGRVFDVDFCDVNGDGRMDLLVTVNKFWGGSVWAYEVPDDFRTGTYKKHQLASGFKSASLGTGKGAPGGAKLVYSKQSPGGKPSILLSGDDGGRAYILTPKSANASDWSYSVDSFLNAGFGTVGQIAAADVDGDGSTEIFVPAYNRNKVYVYRLQ